MTYLPTLKALLITAVIPVVLTATAANVAAAPAGTASAGESRSEDGSSQVQSGHEAPLNDKGEGGKKVQVGDDSREDGDRDRGQDNDDDREAVKATPPVTSRGAPTPKPVNSGTPTTTPTPAPTATAPGPTPAPLPAPQPSTPSTPVLASFSIPTSVVPATGSLAAGVIPPKIQAAVRQPAPAVSPRDPEQFPQGGVFDFVQPNTLNTSLAAALAALPLLLALWIAAFLRIAATARREVAARNHLALAAELGIAPLRLAGLLPRELSVLREKVAFDELTGIMRRAGGLATLDREIARARRRKTPLSIAFVDVDGLKAVNDARGHAAGDVLLKDVAGVLQGRLRAEDAIFRYGGDEFCCVLPDADRAAAGRIVDDALAAAHARGVSFSAGLAQLSPDDDRASLLARADAELYRGRAARGNGGR